MAANVNVIRYEDFIPNCKFQKEEEFDTYEISLHGFRIEQLKVDMKDDKTINIKGERQMDGNRWSRFSHEFKIPSDVYNTKNISATFGNGLLSIKLPKKKPSSDVFASASLHPMLKEISQREILTIKAIAVVVAVAVGGYVTFKYLKKH